jgi:hypothetical protein
VSHYVGRYLSALLYKPARPQMYLNSYIYMLSTSIRFINTSSVVGRRSGKPRHFDNILLHPHQHITTCALPLFPRP